MPLFTTINIDSKLDASDAKFVDVIHTNAGWKGKLEPCGHVDFYPNGGYEQVGCKATETDGMLDYREQATFPLVGLVPTCS